MSNSDTLRSSAPPPGDEDVAIYLEPQKRAIVSIALLVAVFGCNFSFRSFGIALPHIIASWDAMDLYTLGASLMTVAMTVSTIVVARISPRTGLKATITFGLILLLVCNMLTLFAPNMLVFVLLRILTGVGNGVICGQMAASMNKIWPSAKRGTWMGILGIFQSFTSVIGPTVSGMLVDSFGWQSTYYTISVFQIVGLLMFIFFCPGDTRDRFYKPVPFDTAGTVTFVLSITALVLVASYANKLGWFSMPIIAGFIVAIISIIGLVKAENKADDKALLPWNLIKNDRNFVKIFGIAFFVAVLGMGQTYFMSLYLQRVAGTSATIAGIPFTLLSVASLLASPVAGRIFQKTGKSKMLMAVTSIIMTLPVLFYGLWIYPEIGGGTGVYILYVTSFVYGLGYILTMTLPYNACAEYLPLDSVGVGTANVYMGITLGGSLGLAILQAVLNAVTASADMNAGIKATFVCCAISGFITLLLALSLKKVNKTV